MTTTRAAAVFTERTDSVAAGKDLGEQARGALDGEAPDALIVFASPRFDYQLLLEALSSACAPAVMVGSSSAGEFTGKARGEGTACALALRSDQVRFSAGIGHGVSTDRVKAAHGLLSSFEGLGKEDFPCRAALVMTDALAGHADDLIEQLTLLTAGGYQFAGGGAGDDAKFTRTHVFHGTNVYSDSVVGLEILSKSAVGIGVGHGWTPASGPLRVTEATDMRIVSINGMPAIEIFEEHARNTEQQLDRADPLPFFLHNILGIDTGYGHRLRVPLAVNEDGSIDCAAEIPAGARVQIMKASSASAVAAASSATAAALKALGGRKPGAALFFDCVATRLRMGDLFGFEIDSVSEMLDGVDLVGCNTYGQIARAEGQFNGFHNCTAVVMVLPS